MNASSSSKDHSSPLIDSLVSGFETLLTTVRAHIDNEKVLRERLDFAANEYEKVLAADSSLSASSAAPSQVVRQIRQVPAINADLDSWAPVRKAHQAIHQYKMSKAQTPQTNGARCPVSHRAKDPEDLERDFTTPGVQGTLGCPFAKMSNGLTPAGQGDPIAAEFHNDKTSTRSPNPEQRAGQCPIRFLDQHSPEEIAKYFENHKHEIPRSHEICVRRYQGNESSARQLDAKYGSLANMIQGLGVKHKAYLPERDRTEERDKSSSDVVEKWAENVSQDAAPAGQDNVVADEEPRLSHFEKPLREIRVGESPSRPWGISVPADKEPTPSALQSEDGVGHLKRRSKSSHGGHETKPTGCPVDHGQRKEPEKKQEEEDDDDAGVGKRDKPRDRPQIIFNGPVFFGYSAEEVAALLQSTNLGGLKPGAG